MFIGTILLVIMFIICTVPPHPVSSMLIHSIQNSKTIDIKLGGGGGHIHHLILAIPNSEVKGHLKGTVKIINDNGHILFKKKFDTDKLEKTSWLHNQDYQAWIITSGFGTLSPLDDTVPNGDYQLQIDITATNQNTTVSLWHYYLEPFEIISRKKTSD